MADPIPSTEGIVATAGKQPVTVVFDFNQDGTPDYLQADPWLQVFSAVSRIVLGFAAPHTDAFEIANKFETVIRPALEGKGR